MPSFVKISFADNAYALQELSWAAYHRQDTKKNTFQCEPGRHPLKNIEGRPALFYFLKTRLPWVLISVLFLASDVQSSISLWHFYQFLLDGMAARIWNVTQGLLEEQCLKSKLFKFSVWKTPGFPFLQRNYSRLDWRRKENKKCLSFQNTFIMPKSLHIGLNLKCCKRRWLSLKT